jgi:DNA-binding CsgD family transcriptional regulator
MQQAIKLASAFAPSTLMAAPFEDMPAGHLASTDMAELLEELDTAVIVCCAEGRVALANNAARRELLCGRPLAIDKHGQLCLAQGAQSALLPWRSALRAAIYQHRRQLLALPDGPHGLTVSVMPLGQHTAWALVMLGRRQPAPDLAVQMLGTLYELTAAEQRVLMGLLAGQRVDAIARERGVKLCTLRTQVSTLREKLGARRLEDLVRLAAELPPMNSALRSPALRMANQHEHGAHALAHVLAHAQAQAQAQTAQAA